MLWFGLLFVAVVLFKPEGIAGAAQTVRRGLEARLPRGTARLSQVSRG